MDRSKESLITGKPSIQRNDGNGEMIKGIGAVMVILAGGGWGMLQAAKIRRVLQTDAISEETDFSDQK